MVTSDCDCLHDMWTNVLGCCPSLAAATGPPVYLAHRAMALHARTAMSILSAVLVIADEALSHEVS